jgi:quercetin dioxygenase-like cupin family protein
MRLLVFFFIVLAASLNLVHADEHPGVSAELLIRSGDDWTGTALPPYLSDVPEVAVMKYTIPPETALPIHQHPSINVAYVVDGEITVVQEGGIQRHFKKGDVIVEMVGKWHHGINQGTKPVELIVFYATTKGLPLAIKKPNP